MNELSVGFTALTPRAVGDLAATIHDKLTNPPGITFFLAPAPTMLVFKTAITKLDTALNGDGTPSNLAARETALAELIEWMKQLAANLELTAKGDLVMLAATGFNFKKARVKSEGPVASPDNLRVKTTGISGEAMAKVAAVALASGYEGQFTLDPSNGPWTSIAVCTSSQSILFTGLSRGKDYYFRVRAIGANGPGGWSDVATMMVV